ncbi:hypothetical protein BYT27DRAFT_6526936 [Phlegmacium glaucopus]|nr:hypothetical protein BYT27DRAFT_6526936 [Phlegmacium glaucopus]
MMQSQRSLPSSSTCRLTVQKPYVSLRPSLRKASGVAFESYTRGEIADLRMTPKAFKPGEVLLSSTALPDILSHRHWSSRCFFLTQFCANHHGSIPLLPISPTRIRRFRRSGRSTVHYYRIHGRLYAEVPRVGRLPKRYYRGIIRLKICPRKRTSSPKISMPGTADQIQLLLKYISTGSYDPADFSFRYHNKHNVLFDGQTKFYLFCQEIQCEALSDVVRAGIQCGLEMISWSPLPTPKDTFVISYPQHRPQEFKSFKLLSLFLAAERYYPKLAQDDPQANFVICKQSLEEL